MQNIKLEDILKIIEQFESSSIDSLRYKTGEEEIELSRTKNGSVTPFNLEDMNSEEVKNLLKKLESKKSTDNALSIEQQQSEQKKEEDQQQESKAAEQKNIYTVTSPIIGIFYSSPAPGKSPYVKEGDKVKKNDILCIIEAMKVMNKIESEVKGEIVEVLAEDSQTVEYGSELFKIKME